MFIIPHKISDHQDSQQRLGRLALSASLSSLATHPAQSPPDPNNDKRDAHHPRYAPTLRVPSTDGSSRYMALTNGA